MKDGKGNLLKDPFGNEISPKNYKQGMVFRCNPDFTGFEVLGHNFRNNYEVAVDSYGTMWQSDNDDDGNKGVRINYVMEYGNYGYTDEMTGAGWQANRTNLEPEIPRRHWHLNDPGVVPNLLQTGAGSPTGMVVYEGTLLPEEFRGQMIHSDAGPNVVRAYPVQKDGAGYKATIVNLVEGTRDQWFRPSDVCVAPDGSLMIADWYDPGVGGHQAGDLNRGRVFRLAPPNTPYKQPALDLNSAKGAVAALQNPNLSVRYQAYQKLSSLGAKAEKELVKLYKATTRA
jgi:putative membrane-bound dehydrogenase-like protein